MVVHGGLAQGDTWLFDLEARAWRSISHESGASPGVRHGATFTPLPHFHPYPRGSVGAGGGNHGGGVYGGSAVFVGGADMEQGTLCNDVWLFSMQRGWTLLQQHHNEPMILVCTGCFRAMHKAPATTPSICIDVDS